MQFIGRILLAAIIAIVLLRPKSDERKLLQIRKIHDLRAKLSLRDLEFLKVASKVLKHPRAVSRDTISLASSNEQWPLENEKEAGDRASRSHLLGVLDPRSSEVQTNSLGDEVTHLDQFIFLLMVGQ